jgi:2-hydroxy-3-keto-5-methylthiopentenyl-1-phosphate phosphatase
MKKTIVAFCYDFDGTLSPGNMQEYGFFESLGDRAKRFWRESEAGAKLNQADPILHYMQYMLEVAKQENIGTTKRDFMNYGRDIKFFPGVESWFERINKYADELNISLEHYIVSSGLKELVEGTKIKRWFRRIYACSYEYDNNNSAKWPAVAVNYTTKTQFLFRINKGIEDDSDNRKINQYLPECERRVPFARMVYFGDGVTDVPCMRLVKDKGGYSVAVYAERTKGKRQAAQNLFNDKRVNSFAPANYTEGSPLDKIVKAVLKKISIEAEIQKISSQNYNQEGGKKSKSSRVVLTEGDEGGEAILPH